MKAKQIIISIALTIGICWLLAVLFDSGKKEPKYPHVAGYQIISGPDGTTVIYDIQR